MAGAELGTGGIPTMKGRLFQLWPHAGRWLVGVLLLWAGISKLANPTEFLGAVYSYELPLPRLGLKLLAASLPWAELLLALMLLARYWIQSALWGGLILLAGFTLATGQAWVRGLSIGCGCFDLSILGIRADGTAWDSVGLAFWRNLFLTGIVVALLVAEGSPGREESVGSAGRPASGSGRRRQAKRRQARVVA